MAMTVRERTKEVGRGKPSAFSAANALLFVSEARVVAVIWGLIGVGGTLLLFRSIDFSLYIPNVQTFIPPLDTGRSANRLCGLVWRAWFIRPSRRE